MLAVVGNRVSEFLVEGTLGILLLAGAVYFLLALFRRDRGDNGPRDQPRRW